MNRNKAPILIAALLLVVAACATGTTTTTTSATTTTAATSTTAEPTTTAGPSTTAAGDPLAEFGESTNADPALVAEALGPDIQPSDDDSWNIILASIARATQELDEATVAKAMECFNNQECDTGTGGDIVMGYADGGGDTVNIWRAVSHMEAILQALTYDEIGAIVSTEANFGGPTFDPTIAENDIRFLINRGVDFIVGYPDIGVGLREEVLEAEAAGIPYITFSAGYVGLPGTEGALTPGEDHLTVVGEDLCALGESFADVLNTGVGTGEVAVLGGTPNNALSLGWQQCVIPALSDGIELVNPPANENTTTGDTYWADASIPDVYRGLLTANPEIKGWAYEYSDGQNIGLGVYEELGIPVENLTVALRTDEQSLFCDWVVRAEPTYNIWYSAGGNFQSRVGVTAAMLNIAGAPIPAEIEVPHLMRQVTAADCDPDWTFADAAVSRSSLVPDEVMSLMFASS
jgi:hypothetical protein